MTDKNIKNQRDRFLAFAFASSDLFIEVDENDAIQFALGAAKGVIGVDEKSLIGQSWLNLFDPTDRPVLAAMKEKAKAVIRIGPMMVTMNKDISDGKKAFITGIKMPDSNQFYLTLGLSNIMMSKIGEMMRRAEDGEILNKNTFTETAKDVIETARSLGQNIDLTFLDFDASNDDKKRIGSDNWNKLLNAINTFLLSKSVDGQSAAEIAEGRYSIIHEKGVNASTLIEQIRTLIKETAPQEKGIEVNSKTLSTDIKTLSERDTGRALVYTINEFERKGTGFSIDTLNSGFDNYLKANEKKIKEFQSFIDRLHFSLYLQPIVDLKTLEPTHYEMLSRFEEGNTQEWIMFGEDIGMAADFDLAVCERAMNYVNFKAGGTHTKFSINLSGQSIENESFFNDLKTLLNKKSNLKNRLLFEITESAHINNLDKVAEFINDLRNEGYQVALDDFGAGASSFQYLQALNVDYVKIDGKYIRKILSSQRDLALVKNLALMCADLGFKVIAEYIETVQQVEILRELGIEYGQGYLFGKPASDPRSIKPEGLEYDKAQKR